MDVKEEQGLTGPSSPNGVTGHSTKATISSPSASGAHATAEEDQNAEASSSRSPVKREVKSPSPAGVAEPANGVEASAVSPSKRTLRASFADNNGDVKDSPASSGSRIELTPVTTSLQPPARRKKKVTDSAEDAPVQIIDHLPRADEEALSTFTVLQDNWYANKSIGRSKGHEWGLVCECNYRPGLDDISRACTEEGGCINRLTQVECLTADCRCGEDCQNQRFQRKEYADLEVVKTEKKGYGLRAKRSIAAEAFVYEYIGEVVEEEAFRKRMTRYHDERIPHFYFMMLQRDEYLDATKKGGIARFINHSCNPNCYVAKWHVGKHMRMGIFAQRDILKGEELTFNYNVDRYGNEAQPCYCGEPNCVGQLGGKTQTDIGGMSNLYIEALGIADEVEELQARGSRKQKSRVLDEDFTPTLRPLEEDEVPTVATAIRQAASNRSILCKLLTRIDITTENVSVQKRFVRLHGFVLMAGVLNEWKDDKEVLLLSMRILAKWPLIARNKVVDTGVEAIIEGLSKSEDGDTSSLASELFDAWQKLSLEFRIARKEGGEEENEVASTVEDDHYQRSRRRRDDQEEDSAIQDRMDYALDHAQAPNDVSASLGAVVPRPLGKTAAASTSSSAATSLRYASRMSGAGPRASGGPANGWGRSHSSRTGLATPATPGTPDESAPDGSSKASQQPSMSIEEIIRRANEAQEEERKRQEERIAQQISQREAEDSMAVVKAGSSKSKHRSDREKEAARAQRKRKAGIDDGASTLASSSSTSTPMSSDKKARSSAAGTDGTAMTTPSSSTSTGLNERSLDKKLHLLVSEIVLRCMSPLRHSISKDSFKKHARQLTDVICSKERKNPKSWPPRDGKLEKLSGDKREKMRAFAKEYVGKLEARKKKGDGEGEGEGGESSRARKQENGGAEDGSDDDDGGSAAVDVGGENGDVTLGDVTEIDVSMVDDGDEEERQS